MTDLEQQAREFARLWCRQHGKNSRHVRIQFAVDFAAVREKEIAALRRENRHLRRGWGWERCGTHAYHDDGEFACNGTVSGGGHEHGAIDWMRDSVDQIEATLSAAGKLWFKEHPHEVTAAMSEKIELAKEIASLRARVAELEGKSGELRSATATLLGTDEYDADWGGYCDRAQRALDAFVPPPPPEGTEAK